MPSNTVQLSEFSSFSVEDVDNNPAAKRIRFFYDDPKKKYENLLLVSFPLGEPPMTPIEQPMHYSTEEKRWVATLDRPIDAREQFIIVPNVTLQDDLQVRQVKAQNPLQKGYIALKGGVQQPVNKTPGVPEGKLEKFLYTKEGEIKKAVAENELQPGERLITVYLPPGYDKNRKPPYNFQVTLDGGQYLETMQMDTILDNLIAENEIEPVVNVFISPYTGPPNSEFPGLPPVAPAGYSLEMRYKEYACNPEFAEKLSILPHTMQEQFNITNNPDNTTIWGLSMGGLQAEYMALIYPDVFGNVVAQSPMAWNIPQQNGANWREQITDDWKTSTAPLPADEEHNEYLTTALIDEYDQISGLPIKPFNPLKFYFDAGDYEKRYEPEKGFANLVVATEIFAQTLHNKGHKVVGPLVSPGGHDAMTWMGNIPDAARIMHPCSMPRKQLYTVPVREEQKASSISKSLLSNVSQDNFSSSSSPPGKEIDPNIPKKRF